PLGGGPEEPGDQGLRRALSRRQGRLRVGQPAEAPEPDPRLLRLELRRLPRALGDPCRGLARGAEDHDPPGLRHERRGRLRRRVRGRGPAAGPLTARAPLPSPPAPGRAYRASQPPSTPRIVPVT